ncbi:MAG: methyltransferase domain-containing protein [Thermoanaerobaculia bacterium]
MRRAHFEDLAPVCPVCAMARRTREASGAGLEIASALREEPGHLIEGIVRCSDPSCLSEFPVIEGIPYLVSGLRGLIARDVGQILARNDLSAEMESLLGDCCGPGSQFDTTRQQLSSYGWDHWADLDPVEDRTGRGGEPGSVTRLLAEAVDRAGELPDGPVLDLGCSVGRVTFELAGRTGRKTLGVDLNTAMLRMAAGVLRHGQVRYPRRKTGLVYDAREFEVDLPGADRTDFWACDAVALPVAAASFAAIVGLNFLDSAQSPVDALTSIFRVLMPGGKALLACPYDWTPGATPVEGWIGGHSQRGEHRGSPEQILRALLTPGAHPASIDGARILADEESLPWRVRMHDRSTIEYRTHLIIAEKLADVDSD